jgi:hypothetical protein
MTKNSRYWVLGTWSWVKVPSSKVQVSGFKFQVPGSRLIYRLPLNTHHSSDGADLQSVPISNGTDYKSAPAVYRSPLTAYRLPFNTRCSPLIAHRSSLIILSYPSIVLLAPLLRVQYLGSQFVHSCFQYPGVTKEPSLVLSCFSYIANTG